MKVRVEYTLSEDHEDVVEVSDDYGAAEVTDAVRELHPFADEIQVHYYEETDGG